MPIDMLHIVKSQTSKLPISDLSLFCSDDQKKSEADDGDATKKYKNTFVLKDAIEIALNKMAKDKGDEPSKKIPHGFYEFANSPQYKELLEAMLDYNRELFRLENKQ